MLKSKLSKIIIGAAGILAVLIVASICVTSIFNKKTDVEEFDYSLLATAEDAASSTLTQIDYIIQEANPYKVLIIADNAADVESVKTFFESGDGFRQYVINDNRTIEQLMEEGKVSVDVKTAASYRSSDKETISTSLSDVDMIFLYGKDSGSFTGGNAISENLYECLHNYISANKPMILSYYQIKNSSDVIVTTESSGYNSKVFNLTTVSFKNSWKRSNTTNISDWKYEVASGASDGQVQQVIKSYIESSRSAYTRYSMNDSNVPNGYENWTSYWSRVDGESKLHVLMIFGGEQNDSGAETSSLAAEEADIRAVGEWMVDQNTGGGARRTFNTEITSNIPTDVEVHAVRASDLVVNPAADSVDTTNALYVNGVNGPVKQYDYIFIAPDTYHPNYDMSDDVVSALQSLSVATDSKTYILFGTLKGKTTTSTTTTSSGDHDPFSVGIDTTTNYGKLVDLCVTTTAYAKKSNVLPVGTTYMSDVAANPNNQPTKIAQIVSLINKSNYKTHAGSGNGGGSGSVSTEAFRVLELQPCYPIDLELAVSLNSDKPTDMLSKFTYVDNLNKDNQGDAYLWGGYNFTTPLGNYYTIPADVLNSSEIDQYMVENTDSNGNVVSKSMNQEYYDWDLSKAKIAYALGMSTDQIELVQMSTEEYITAKADVSDAYDLIYIGGNMSAFKNSNAYGVDIAAADNSIYPVRQENMGIYSMYTHTGEITAVRGEHVGDSGPLSSKFTTLNGNDITYDRYNQLVAYIDSGLPVVFSNEVWEKFESAESMSNKYANRYIDPDSNMYHLMQYANQKSGTTSVLTNWNTKVRKDSTDLFYKDYYNDAATMLIENDKGIYGSSPYVTVYQDQSLNDALYNCVYGSDTNMRPKFSLKTTAVTYVEGDSTTKLKNHDVSWDVTLLNPVAGHTYEAFILQDKNDNGVFEVDTEKVVSSVTLDGATGQASLAYTYPTNEFGAFNWKLMVQDTTTKATAATSSITVFDISKKVEKMSASILEIMPMTQDNCTSSNPSAPDGHTFYLDKNYQQSSGNPFLFSSFGTSAWNDYGHCPSIQSPGKADDGKDSSSPEFTFNSNYIAGAYKNGHFNNGAESGLYMGKYKAELSVNRYDTTAGHEDRDYNYMDLVSDMYDFNLDIMYMDDILYYAKAARDESIDRENCLKEANKAYEEYISYTTPGTTNYAELNAVETELRTALKNIRDGVSFDTPNKSSVINPSDYETYGINAMLVSKDYFRFFYLNTTGVDTPTGNMDQPAVRFYFAYYKPYIDVHDKMIEAYRKYRHYNMLAYGPEQYLRQNYDVVVIGFMDDYAGDYTTLSQDAVNDLITFTQKKDVVDSEGNELPAGSLLMTHDNMTAFANGSHALNLTSTLRGYAGLNGFSKLTLDSSTSSSLYPKYTATDSNRYFLTNISTNSYEREVSTYDVLANIYSKGMNKTIPDLNASWRTQPVNPYYDGEKITLFNFIAAGSDNWVPGFGMTIPESDIATFTTVQDIIDYIDSHKAASSGPAFDLSKSSALTGTSWNDAVTKWGTKTTYTNANRTYKPMGFTDIYNVYRTGGYGQTVRYIYGELEMQKAIEYNIQLSGPLKVTGSAKATQVNRGVVTSYPFYIASDLRVSNTHGQAYALDLENQDVAVWYTLAGDNQSVAGKAGGTDYTLMKQNSSLFAASPKDGMDSYYIYSVGNIVYCGAGHSLITGYMRDNNDERRLFLNVLINMAKHSTLRPKEVDDDEIILYDPDGVTKAPGNVVKENASDGYYINVDSNITYPEFGFAFKKNSGEIIQSVEIFYDLDYDGTKNTNQNVYTDDKNHFKVFMTDAQQAALIAKLATVDSSKNPVPVIISKDDFPTLVTEKRFFDAYEGKDHTYIVINVSVKDTSGKTKVVSERIKIKLTKDLLDLT